MVHEYGFRWHECVPIIVYSLFYVSSIYMSLVLSKVKLEILFFSVYLQHIY